MSEILDKRPPKIEIDKLLIRCPAKINLFLNINGLVDNGYHLVTLINQTVSLEDEILLTRGGTGKFTVDNPNIPTDEQNSVIKALKVFMHHTGANDLFDITLKKRIPTMSGLGGESTDAAGMLIGLNILTGSYLSNNELKRLAIQVGSDVPFFIDGGYKKVTGIGETVENWGSDNPYNNYLIVMPNFSCNTKDMYKRLDQATGGEYGSKLYWGLMHNDFEAIADPRIHDIKNLLLENGAFTAGMTGSGSAVVGAFTATPNVPFREIQSIYPNSFQVTNSRGISIIKAR